MARKRCPIHNLYWFSTTGVKPSPTECSISATIERTDYSYSSDLVLNGIGLLSINGDTTSHIEFDGVGQLDVNAEVSAAVIDVQFGYMYNWYAVNDSRLIYNTGWHVPTDSEFAALEVYAGNNEVAALALKDTSSLYWNTTPGVGNNTLGLSIRGTGQRQATFSNLKDTSIIWTGSSYSATVVWYSIIGSSMAIQGTTPYVGHSVRLVKDSTTLSNGESGMYTGNDGKNYSTICINGVEWLGSALCETKYANGDWIDGYNNGSYTSIDSTTWQGLTTGALCAYNDNESLAL